MKPILYGAEETEFNTNGIGRLNPSRCVVTEERNGQFELQMDLSVDDRHFLDVEEGAIVYSIHDDTKSMQPFDIYKISRPINGKVTVNARHVTYRLANIVVSPFSALSCPAALNGLLSHASSSHNFTVWTDKETEGHFILEKPEPLRPRLGGMTGSILDVYGGADYEWDHFQVKLHAHRGVDSGITLKYGKDITALTKVTDSTNFWNGIYPFWFGASEEGEDVLVELPEKIMYTNARSYMLRDVIAAIDMSQDFQDQPTIAQIRNAARKYIADNGKTGVSSSINVSFVGLKGASGEALAELQHVNLCDTVNIYYPKMGINETAPVTKTVYNVLKERYDSLGLGETRSNLSTQMRASAAAQTRDMVTTKDLKRSVDRSSKIVTGALGGHIAITLDDTGRTQHMYIPTDSADYTTAQNVYRWGANGLEFSSAGYAGPYRSILTSDGHVSGT